MKTIEIKYQGVIEQIFNLEGEIANHDHKGAECNCGSRIEKLAELKKEEKEIEKTVHWACMKVNCDCDDDDSINGN